MVHLSRPNFRRKDELLSDNIVHSVAAPIFLLSVQEALQVNRYDEQLKCTAPNDGRGLNEVSEPGRGKSSRD